MTIEEIRRYIQLQEKLFKNGHQVNLHDPDWHEFEELNNKYKHMVDNINQIRKERIYENLKDKPQTKTI